MCMFSGPVKQNNSILHSWDSSVTVYLNAYYMNVGEQK